MLGNWIKTERERHGWSQRELGQRARLSQPAITLVENGDRQPRPETLESIAQAFGLSVQAMYQAAYGNAVAETIDQLQGEGVPADVLTELEQAAPDLSPTQWGIVVAVVRDMAGRKPTRRPQRAQRAESPTEPEQEDDGRDHRATARGLRRMRA